MFKSQKEIHRCETCGENNFVLPIHCETCKKISIIKDSTKNGNIILNNILYTDKFVDIINFAQDIVLYPAPIDLYTILTSKRSILEETIALINCNPTKPEYHNIYYTDPENANGEVCVDGKWILMSFNEIADALINTKLENLTKILQSHCMIMAPEYTAQLYRFVSNFISTQRMTDNDKTHCSNSCQW